MVSQVPLKHTHKTERSEKNLGTQTPLSIFVLYSLVWAKISLSVLGTLKTEVLENVVAWLKP